jgi:hypothetical protein
MYAYPRPRRSGPLELPSRGCHRIRAIRRLGCLLAGGLLAFRAVSPTAFTYRALPPSGSYEYCARRQQPSRLRCAAPSSAVHQRRAAGSLLAPSSGRDIAPQAPTPRPAYTHPKRTRPDER